MLDHPEVSPSAQTEVALIVGAGPGISASCARLLAANGFKVAIAARTATKPVMLELAQNAAIHCYSCDAGNASEVEQLFSAVRADLGAPTLVIHNIDGRSAGIFRKGVAEADADLVLDTLVNSALSAFNVAQQAARSMRSRDLPESGHRGTVIFTNASATLKGFAKSAAFAMACQAKTGLAQSMARELMPEGIHVAQVIIDAAVGVPQADGSRKHWAAGVTEDDNMADPNQIAQVYLQLHQQHRSTWAFEVALRPWNEKW
ncbi:SDR family NAD(P)-dependent oxidoreductase [Pseudomonas sp. NyZ704]|nr:SDR family NAD(P)-dependent oxidoreductase [Pseudomonas sp. NyZ704]